MLDFDFEVQAQARKERKRVEGLLGIPIHTVADAEESDVEAVERSIEMQ